MSSSAPADLGRIFISYRREDTAFPAAWLFDRLVAHFGEGQVFKDIDTIQPGDDFAGVIGSAVASCDVLLVLIGDRWLTITDENEQRRLDRPDDLVRLEIQAALDRNIRVIPILVGKAMMPHAAELPECLAKLPDKQAFELGPARFDSDIARLLTALDRILSEEAAGHGPVSTGLRGSLELPRDGDEVGGRIEVRGHVTGRRHSYKLWIAHRRELNGAFWLKPPEVRPDDTGNFSAAVFEGGSGGTLIISLLAVFSSRSRDFENWLHRAEQTGHYPGIFPTSADNELVSVTVSYVPGA
jgi:hypothetical protein